METKQEIWKRNRRFGNETGGSDREQHFVTHDRRAYLESGDVSNRLQSPNMWKVKRKTNVYLLFLCAGARWRILFHLPLFLLWVLLGDGGLHSSIGDLTMVFTIPLLPPASRRVADVLKRGQISPPAEAGAAAGSESDFSPPCFL